MTIIWREEWPDQLTDAVDIVLLNLSKVTAQTPDWLHYLNPEEQERAQRFHFDIHRQRFIAGRMALRTLLGRYLNIAPQNVDLIYTRYGKPELAPRQNNIDLSFNLSHSHDMAIFAFTKNVEIGIDIEHAVGDRDCRGLAARFFSETESAQLLALPPDQITTGFFNCWTRKEAFIKALGEGLSHPLDNFVVSLRPEDEPALLEIDGDAAAAKHWCLRALDTVPDYTAAVIIRLPTMELRYYKCPVIQ